MQRKVSSGCVHSTTYCVYLLGALLTRGRLGNQISETNDEIMKIYTLAVCLQCAIYIAYFSQGSQIVLALSLESQNSQHSINYVLDASCFFSFWYRNENSSLYICIQ